MDDDAKKSELPAKGNATDYMANERTFLAWIRTSIGIMAFGFVVEKFALFVRQISLLLGSSSAIPSIHSHPISSVNGHSSAFGMLIVALGTIMCFLAFLQYRKVEKQIANNTYRPSGLLSMFLTAVILLIGLFLIVYLNSNI